MKVLLIQDVRGLGKKGEIKEVKEGYGRNFLIPKKLVKLATPEVIAEWEAEQQKLKELEAEEIKKFNEFKKILESKEIKISKKLGANGMLYGAITKEDVKEALEKININIDKKSLDMKPIKSTGIYEIDVKLGHGIHAKLKLNVEGEV